MTAKRLIMSPEEMRRKRELMKMTQEEFAEKLQVHRVSVARWETGTLDIDERTRLAVEHLVYKKKREALYKKQREETHKNTSAN